MSLSGAGRNTVDSPGVEGWLGSDGSANGDSCGGLCRVPAIPVTEVVYGFSGCGDVIDCSFLTPGSRQYEYSAGVAALGWVVGRIEL